MARWYNAYLNKEDMHKQIGQKGITARRRKKQSQAIAQSVSKAGIVGSRSPKNAPATGTEDETRRKLKDAFNRAK